MPRNATPRVRDGAVVTKASGHSQVYLDVNGRAAEVLPIAGQTAVVRAGDQVLMTLEHGRWWPTNTVLPDVNGPAGAAKFLAARNGVPLLIWGQHIGGKLRWSLTDRAGNPIKMEYLDMIERADGMRFANNVTEVFELPPHGHARVIAATVTNPKLAFILRQVHQWLDTRDWEP